MWEDGEFLVQGVYVGRLRNARKGKWATANGAADTTYAGYLEMQARKERIA